MLYKQRSSLDFKCCIALSLGTVNQDSRNALTVPVPGVLTTLSSSRRTPHPYTLLLMLLLTRELCEEGACQGLPIEFRRLYLLMPRLGGVFFRMWGMTCSLQAPWPAASPMTDDRSRRKENLKKMPN